jgi:hypothetical protein
VPSRLIRTARVHAAAELPEGESAPPPAPACSARPHRPRCPGGQAVRCEPHRFRDSQTTQSARGVDDGGSQPDERVGRRQPTSRIATSRAGPGGSAGPSSALEGERWPAAGWASAMDEPTTCPIAETQGHQTP